MRRWPRIVVGTTALVAVAALAGPTAVRGYADRRDQDGFTRYISSYLGSSYTSQLDTRDADRRWASTRPGVVLEEGDRACRWLASQPVPPRVHPAGGFTVDTLTGRYVETPAAGVLVGLSNGARGDIAAGAWQYLCPQTFHDHSAPRAEHDD